MKGGERLLTSVGGGKSRQVENFISSGICEAGGPTSASGTESRAV